MLPGPVLQVVFEAQINQSPSSITVVDFTLVRWSVSFSGFWVRDFPARAPRLHPVTLPPLTKRPPHVGERSPVPKDYSVLERLQKQRVIFAKHALPLPTVVGEDFDVRVHRRGELGHSIDQPLVILIPQSNQEVVVASPGPIPTGHGSEQHNELQLLAVSVYQGVEEGG